MCFTTAVAQWSECLPWLSLGLDIPESLKQVVVGSGLVSSMALALCLYYDSV